MLRSFKNLLVGVGGTLADPFPGSAAAISLNGSKDDLWMVCRTKERSDKDEMSVRLDGDALESVDSFDEWSEVLALIGLVAALGWVVGGYGAEDVDELEDMEDGEDLYPDRSLASLSDFGFVSWRSFAEISYK